MQIIFGITIIKKTENKKGAEIEKWSNSINSGFRSNINF
jgi:hypothetical protein